LKTSPLDAKVRPSLIKTRKQEDSMQTRFERGSFQKFYEIVINFRSQRRIEELAEEAKKILGGNLERELNTDVTNTLTATQLLIVGGYFEQIGSWHKVELLANLALARPKEELTDEIKIKANFILATRLREMNQSEAALEKYEFALKLAEETKGLDKETKAFWVSNTYRNIGLANLKLGEKNKKDPNMQKEALEKYQAGLKAFETGFEIAKQYKNLTGSLPALANYIALMDSKIYINEPSVNIKFQEANKLYEKTFQTFAEQGIPLTEEDKAAFHDLQSHFTHFANFLRNYAKTVAPAEREGILENALQLLINAYEARKTNKTDGQRLGDSAVAIAEVYRDLNRLEKAIEAAGIAKKHYEDNSKMFHSSGEKVVTDQTRKAEAFLEELQKQKLQTELKAPPPWMNKPYQVSKPEPAYAPSLTPQQSFKP